MKRKMSKETRIKMSQARELWWARNRQRRFNPLFLLTPTYWKTIISQINHKVLT